MRATRATIHLENLRHNIRLLSRHARRLSGREPAFCISVKADGYGHGAAQVARVAFEEGAEAVAVATVEEGARLRDAGINGRVLLYSLAMLEEIPEIVDLRLEPFVADGEYIRAFAQAVSGGPATGAVRVHLKIDTGMGRIGCRPRDAVGLARLIHDSEEVELAGVCTHFPSADSEDQSFTRKQVAALNGTVEEIQREGIEIPCVHAANSGAVLEVGESVLDLARVGIAAYGYYPSHEQRRVLDLRPVMEFESRVVFVKTIGPGRPVSYGRSWTSSRETTIATVPAGYADGYARLLSNSAEVLLFEREAAGEPRRVPVVGRVCMDQFMIDCGPGAPVKRGDRIVMFGPDPRGPDAETVADICRTIPYETLVQINHRVPRVYSHP